MVRGAVTRVSCARGGWGSIGVFRIVDAGKPVSHDLGGRPGSSFSGLLVSKLLRGGLSLGGGGTCG